MLSRMGTSGPALSMNVTPFSRSLWRTATWISLQNFWNNTRGLFPFCGSGYDSERIFGSKDFARCDRFGDGHIISTIVMEI